MATYFDDYQDFLQQTLDKGGAADVVDAAVREFNAIGHPSWNGSDAFAAWLKKTKHVCIECSKEYVLEDDKAVVSCRGPRMCLVCSPRPDGKTDGIGENPAGDA